MAHQLSPTRRSAIRGLGLAALTAGLAVPAIAQTTPPNPESALIDVCNRLVEVETELFLLPRHDEYAPDFGPNNARYKHLRSEQDRLLQLLEGSPLPTTPAGMTATARAAMTWVELDNEGNALHHDSGEQLMLMLTESAAAGFVWPPQADSCPASADWAQQMTPEEIVINQAAADAEIEARAQAYREAMAREGAARRAEKGVGTVPAGRQELLGMDVEGSLYVWDTGNIQPITGLDDQGLYISSGHYLIWWKGRAVAVHLSSRTDLKICVHFMCNSGPILAMERQEVEDIVVGKRIEDPAHKANMLGLLDECHKALHRNQTQAAKLRGKVLA